MSHSKQLHLAFVFKVGRCKLFEEALGFRSIMGYVPYMICSQSTGFLIEFYLCVTVVLEQSPVLFPAFLDEFPFVIDYLFNALVYILTGITEFLPILEKII